MKRWKSTAREVVTSVVAFLPVFVVIGDELGWEDLPSMAGAFAAVAAVSTALSSPAGKEWLRREVGETGDYVGRRRKDD